MLDLSACHLGLATFQVLAGLAWLCTGQHSSGQSFVNCPPASILRLVLVSDFGFGNQCAFCCFTMYF